MYSPEESRIRGNHFAWTSKNLIQIIQVFLIETNLVKIRKKADNNIVSSRFENFGMVGCKQVLTCLSFFKCNERGLRNMNLSSQFRNLLWHIEKSSLNNDEKTHPLIVLVVPTSLSFTLRWVTNVF